MQPEPILIFALHINSSRKHLFVQRMYTTLESYNLKKSTWTGESCITFGSPLKRAILVFL